MYQNILIGVEGKPTDKAAIVHAATLAEQEVANLVVLQVVTIAADDSGMRHLQLEPGANGWKRKNQAEVNLATIQEQFKRHGLNAEVGVVVSDRSEADEIVDLASRGNFDLIIMAADGRPWWRRALFGGIADAVHHKATVPTLFVSDGSRREQVHTREKPPVQHPILEALGEVEIG